VQLILATACSNASSPSDAGAVENSIPKSLSVEPETSKALTDANNAQLLKIGEYLQVTPDSDLIYSLPAGATTGQYQDRQSKYSALKPDQKMLVDSARNLCAIKNPKAVKTQDFTKDERGVPQVGSQQVQEDQSSLTGDACPILDQGNTKQTATLKALNFDQNNPQNTKVVMSLTYTNHKAVVLQDKIMLAKYGPISYTLDIGGAGAVVSNGMGSDHFFVKGYGTSIVNLNSQSLNLPLEFQFLQHKTGNSVDQTQAEIYLKISIPVNDQMAVIQVHYEMNGNNAPSFTGWLNGKSLTKSEFEKIFGPDFFISTIALNSGH
jgi:hypothetical protein